MGGGGSTTQRVEMPEDVQNLMIQSAAHMGNLQNVLGVESPYFAGFQRNETAGLNTLQNWGMNLIPGMGQPPGAEQQLLQGLSGLSGRAGQVPSGFWDATGQRPEASQHALNLLGGLQGTAGSVSPLFAQAAQTPEQSRLAGLLAGGASQQAQDALAAFNIPMQFLQQNQAEQGGFALPMQFLQQHQASLVPVQGFEALQRQLEGRQLLPVGGTLETSPALAEANQAFLRTIQPTVENQAALSGLGRSTALTNATAQAQAQYMLPLVQEELNREFQANQLGYGSARDLGLARLGQRAQEQQMGQQAALQTQQLGTNVGLQDALAAQQAALQTQQLGTNVGLQEALAASQVPQTMLQSAQMLSQLGQQDTARLLEAANAEERGTVRRTQAIETAIQTLQAQGQQDLARQLEMATAQERGLTRDIAATEAGFQPLLQLGAADTARQQQQFDAAMHAGQLQQQTEQAAYDSAYNERLRQQALAENATFGPFGQLIPSAIGQRVNQSGGGLFK